MDLGLFVFLLLLPVRRTAQVAARLAAELTEGAVRTGILFQCLLIHGYILQPFSLKTGSVA